MTKTIVNPPSLPKPSGYVHGIITEGGRMLFLAGQPGLDASGRIAVPGDLVAQFAQAVSNLQTVVQAAGGKLTDIVKLTIYVRDRDAYKANLKPLGAVWLSHFGRFYPAVTLVQVVDLFDDGALVEIDGIAVLHAD
jgi:enamine deaminase RidA (YjgF/YER057c/UK114 family)